MLTRYFGIVHRDRVCVSVFIMMSIYTCYERLWLIVLCLTKTHVYSSCHFHLDKYLGIKVTSKYARFAQHLAHPSRKKNSLHIYKLHCLKTDKHMPTWFCTKENLEKKEEIGEIRRSRRPASMKMESPKDTQSCHGERCVGRRWGRSTPYCSIGISALAAAFHWLPVHRYM